MSDDGDHDDDDDDDGEADDSEADDSEHDDDDDWSTVGPKACAVLCARSGRW